VDFAEGQEAVAVAAIVDKGRLQRRFDPGYLGEIDIAFELLVLGRFEVEFLDPVTFYDCDPGLLRVARVDQHAHCHHDVSTRAPRLRSLCGARALLWTAARRRQKRRARGRGDVRVKTEMARAAALRRPATKAGVKPVPSSP
jgi:hypothetical protein